MKARPILKIIEGSRVLVKVPLSDGLRAAEIWAEDLELLQSLGVHLNWHALKSGHVTCHGRRSASSKVLVARVLVDAGVGEIVRYKDGNPLNLRRENLSLVPDAKGRARARDFISKEPGIVLCR